MSADEVSAINLGYQHTQVNLRKEEERAREVKTLLVAQERQRHAERKSFDDIQNELVSVSKDLKGDTSVRSKSQRATQARAPILTELTYRTKVSESLGSKLRLQRAKIAKSENLIAQTKEQQVGILRVKRKLEEKLDKISTLISQRKLAKQRQLESTHQEEQIELHLAQRQIFTDKQKDMAIAEPLTSEKLLESEGTQDSSSVSDDPTLQVQAVQNDAVPTDTRSVTESLGSQNGAGSLDSRTPGRGGYAEPRPGDVGAKSTPSSSTGFRELMVKPPSEYLNQIEGLESWQGLSGSGVSFTFETLTGSKLKLELVGNSKNDLSIAIRPETEIDRRTLWAERARIGAALKSAGLSVRQIVLRGPER